MSVIDFRHIQEMKGSKICSLCKEKFWGFGHNPQPTFNLKVEDRCCAECNERVVVPRRTREANREIN